MTDKEMWALCGVTGEYEAWSFGDDPDGLAALVLRGAKTATSSAYPLYETECEELPKVGEYNVILDSEDNAVCVTRTTRVYIRAFCDVTPEHAAKEGEGDLSLEHWRRVHRDFFKEELASCSLEFDETMPVVCEEFELVYPQKTG